MTIRTGEVFGGPKRGASSEQRRRHRCATPWERQAAPQLNVCYTLVV